MPHSILFHLKDENKPEKLSAFKREPRATMLCKCYASAMQVLCKCYANTMQVLCKYYASAMQVLCNAASFRKSEAKNIGDLKKRELSFAHA